MKITPREAFELGIWEKICELGEINEWAINEGLLDDNEVLDIDVFQNKT